MGPPAADEVMEEQDNTERTNPRHESHTPHTETVRGESSSGTTLGDISLLDRSMYFWASAVQTPVEQHIIFDMTQPPRFSPPDASHVSVLLLFYLYKLNT